MSNAKSDGIELPEVLSLFKGTGGGIESWLNDDTPREVVDRLNSIDRDPLTYEHLNQLLILSHEAGFSEGFFEYYWLSFPTSENPHPYDVEALKNFSPGHISMERRIVSAEHLAWGLERLYVDSLLFFGNVREGYRELRNLSFVALRMLFKNKCYDFPRLTRRTAPLKMNEIQRDSRYLIAEVACKTYAPSRIEDLRKFLKDRYLELEGTGIKRITIRQLLGIKEDGEPDGRQIQMPLPLFDASFSLTEILDEELKGDSEVEKHLDALAEKFASARAKALKNTSLYLSLAYDLDAYVATSMRSREDFRVMADRCRSIFDHQSLKKYSLRYFDPTISAADSHEDKGLIECLMVKCAKILIYMAGLKESYGKDAEAAMALSLGKPVIFLCDPALRVAFYRDVHPLSRLINFSNGVAVGAIVTDKEDDVALLIDRIFSNSMRYELEKKRENYLLLKEQQTSSVVRIQTDDRLLSETFWNYYHSNPTGFCDSV